MSLQKVKKQEWALASYLLDDAYTDFILSRKAMLCSPGTLRFYKFTAGKFVESLKSKNINSPEKILSRHIRVYLADLDSRGLSDSYIHGHARAIRTFMRFLHTEHYINTQITFNMPSIAKKRLPILSAKDLQSAINACLTPRDKALILFIADTGTRRAELCTLDWCDVDLETGLVRIDKGKGGKYRTVVIGVTTRRTLLSYRRTVPHQEGSPLFQAMSGKRLTHMGVRSALMRVGERADVKITAHALRRTFATLSLRAGMNLLESQAFLGHASLETTRRYIEILDEDLLNAHKDHGPIDVFVKNL